MGMAAWGDRAGVLRGDRAGCCGVVGRVWVAGWVVGR